MEVEEIFPVFRYVSHMMPADVKDILLYFFVYIC